MELTIFHCRLGVMLLSPDRGRGWERGLQAPSDCVARAHAAGERIAFVVAPDQGAGCIAQYCGALQEELTSPMPLHWFIDSREKFVEITAEGGVGHADVTACLDAVVGADALGYRKLVDCAAGVLAMNAEEIMTIVARVRSLHGGTIGAAALILPDESQEPLRRLLGALASADRPLRLFNSKAAASHWIHGLGDPVPNKRS